jgi:hypothetical protein
MVEERAHVTIGHIRAELKAVAGSGSRKNEIYYKACGELSL